MSIYIYIYISATKERGYFDYIRVDIWNSGIPINWTQSHNDVGEHKNAWTCSHKRRNEFEEEYFWKLTPELTDDTKQ